MARAYNIDLEDTGSNPRKSVHKEEKIIITCDKGTSLKSKPKQIDEREIPKH